MKIYIVLGHKEDITDVVGTFYNKEKAFVELDCLDKYITVELVEKEVKNLKSDILYILLGLNEKTGYILDINSNEKEIRKNINKYEKDYLALYIEKTNII